MLIYPRVSEACKLMKSFGDDFYVRVKGKTIDVIHHLGMIRSIQIRFLAEDPGTAPVCPASTCRQCSSGAL